MDMVHFIPPSQRRLTMLAAQADHASVLISGSSGTGKGAIARWIHANSARAALPLITQDRDLPLSEQLPKAQGGSFIINEVSELPLSEQNVLLNFLKSRTISNPVATHIPMLLSVRIIATTSHALENRAQGGLFKPELLEKLCVFHIEMPPLSERADEFEDIIHGLLGEITRELHREYLKALAPEALSALTAYQWPGNLRELRNVLRVAVISAKGDRIEKSDLPEFGHDRVDFRATREAFEKIYLIELLKTFDWQIEKTCRMTRMEEATLRAKIAKHGIRPEVSPIS
jgi:DNA-binding NtrC family response regulator